MANLNIQTGHNVMFKHWYCVSVRYVCCLLSGSCVRAHWGNYRCCFIKSINLTLKVISSLPPFTFIFLFFPSFTNSISSLFLQWSTICTVQMQTHRYPRSTIHRLLLSQSRRIYPRLYLSLSFSLSFIVLRNQNMKTIH